MVKLRGELTKLGVNVAKSRVEESVAGHASGTKMIGQLWAASTSASFFSSQTQKVDRAKLGINTAKLGGDMVKLRGELAKLGVDVAESRGDETLAGHASGTRRIGQSWATSTSAPASGSNPQPHIQGYLAHEKPHPSP